MRVRRQLIGSFLLVLAALTGCGTPPDHLTVRPVHSASRFPIAVPIVAADGAVALDRYLHIVQMARIMAFADAAAAVAPTPPAGTAVASAPQPSNVAGLGPCGGDLPSCAIVQRESGGSYTTINPTGCGGAGCWGKYQFSGAWAGKLGLPTDPATWTPAQQDAAARELWAGGQGCGNWSCG